MSGIVSSIGHAVGSIGQEVGGLLGGALGGQDQPTQPNVQVYQPGGTSSVDTQLQNLLGQQYNNVYGANNPYTANAGDYSAIFNTLYNNPNAAGYQTAAGNAGNIYGQQGTQQAGSANALTASVLGGLPGAANVANLGLDPQSALYRQLLQGTTDTANVNNAAYGLTGQQAAGNTNQAVNNFNIDWQNQQLQRAIQGLAALGGYNTGAGGALTQAANAGTMGAGNVLQGGATPYSTSIGIAGNQGNALNAYIQSLLAPSTTAGSILPGFESYLGEGVDASEGAAQQALADYQTQLNAQGSLGQALGSIGSWGFAPSGFTDSKGNPSSNFGNMINMGANLAATAGSLFGL